jgi:glycosyltransferase involved in cell wall biosynthesis
MNPRFTFAICTFNRADVLPLAIRAAAAVIPVEGDFEVLVVDNVSTDDTPKVLDQLCPEIPRLRRCVETQKGLSHARNGAIREARGEWIIFLDDDALVVPGYLQTLEKLLAEENNIVACGGIIEVGWLSPVPDWYEPGLDVHFNHHYLSSYRMEIKYPYAVYGTNMCYPTELLRNHGGFSKDFGYAGTHESITGEDVEMQLRLQLAGAGRTVWEPELRVRHLIHPGRLTPAKLQSKVEWSGRSTARMNRVHKQLGFHRILRGIAIKYRLRRLLGRGPKNLTGIIHEAYHRAYLEEWSRWRPKSS